MFRSLIVSIVFQRLQLQTFRFESCFELHKSCRVESGLRFRINHDRMGVQMNGELDGVLYRQQDIFKCRNNQAAPTVCPSVRLSLPVRTYVRSGLRVRPSVCPSVRLSVCRCPSVRTSVRACASVRPSVRLSVCPSVPARPYVRLFGPARPSVS